MTVLVGYLAGKCGHAPLNLAVELARTRHTDLVVTAVVPRPWATPSPARIDAEFAAYAQQLGSDSQREARAHLAEIAEDLTVSHLLVPSRTAGDGLLEAVERTDPDVLVVGSSASGALGQVVLGSTTDWLLHASPIPVAMSPRGYRGARAGRVRRVTCAFSGTTESIRLVEQVAEWTANLEVAMRVVSYAIRGRTMFPPEVGQLREVTAKLKSDHIVGDEVEVQVIAGNGWDQALDATDWDDGDLLTLGTTPRRSLKGVFLGSHGAKILRYSPVPVLVLPA
jgi:nucleotide-binding universal stress UspA family protein